jgi:uncharacterized protein (TIGR02594 family)
MTDLLKRLAGALALLLRRARKPEPGMPSKPPPTPAAAPAPPDASPAWLAVSAQELGVKETPGPRATPRIMAYRAIAGCDLAGDDGAVAWCKIYVNAVFALAELPIEKVWMARAIERDPNFVRLAGPAVGAVCSFWRGTRGGGLGHVGFYCGETASGKILVEGGNENDAVRRAFYPKNGRSMGLVGYYWPRSRPLPDVGVVHVDDDGQPYASAA